jgi:hypothetical protein
MKNTALLRSLGWKNNCNQTIMPLNFGSVNINVVSFELFVISYHASLTFYTYHTIEPKMQISNYL